MLTSTRMLARVSLTALGLWLVGTCPRPAAADDALLPLDIRQVHVGGEIGRRIDVTVNNNLLVLNADKDFLAPFKSKTTRDGYIGLGKLIDAAVRFAAYTNSEKAIALKKHLVDEIMAAQLPDGYIGMMVPEARMWAAWDIHEMGYIIFGLATDYHYFGEKRSLEAARKAADYILARWSAMPADWPQREKVAVHVLVTGLERTLLTLSRECNDPRYRDFVLGQRGLPQWNLGIVIGRRAPIEGHAYAYLARSLAQLELYRSQPQASLLVPAHRAVHFNTAGDGMAITGAVGQAEIWTDDQDGRTALGETCATAYLLRVYDSLLRLEGNPRFGDLMERTIYNTLFAAQSPDGRRIRYFSPFEGNREYHSTDTYCCPCNYRRIVAELPAMVYYQMKGGVVAVNLYAPSEATMRLGDAELKIRQETDYPNSGRVTLHVDPSKPTAFSLQLRIPRWCPNASVAVNGKPVAEPVTPGAFLAVRRTWKTGDLVSLDMSMPWRLVAGRKRQSGRAAVMRGPVVFCLNPAQNASLRNQDGADLGFIMIDPASLKTGASNAVRPNGIACQLKAGSDWSAVGCSGNLSLQLTEFPDPDGKCAYFRLPDPSIAVPDELVGDVESGR
jgi:uncharacterized protein